MFVICVNLKLETTVGELLPVVQLLHHYANLNKPVIITFEQLIKFVAYSPHLKDDILLQPSSYSISQLPILSPTMQLFLLEAFSIPLDAIPHFWVALSNIAWNTKLELSSTDGIFKAVYATFGHMRGICMCL
ncbi:hypothetical protein BYT27DRAFT_7219915 [Phlegmacium glaucopus]|nr:hypothetical protein BYT27DRAFT_7219915 [Phlegmacium glaucopus]